MHQIDDGAVRRFFRQDCFDLPQIGAFPSKIGEECKDFIHGFEISIPFAAVKGASLLDGLGGK